MKKFPRENTFLARHKFSLNILKLTLLFILILLAACSPDSETVTIEVTSVVTETVEGQPIITTREVIVPELELKEEGELEPPAATGSEEDSGPLPAEPEDGPKVTVSRGIIPTTNRIGETSAVSTLRGHETNIISAPLQTTRPTSFFAPAERQKWCHLINGMYKKYCG